MATLSGSIAIGDRDSGGHTLGGGMLVAVWIGTGSDNVTFALEYSPDDGVTWEPVTDEAGTAQAITYLAGGQMAQINPPVRAPYFRLYGETGVESAIVEYEFHTV